MKQIIKEVLKAEERVDTALREARESAAETVRVAEGEVADMLSENREKAREIVRTAVVEAEKEAERIREERLRQADEQRDALLHDDTDAMGDLVSRICRIIVAGEPEADIG